MGSKNFIFSYPTGKLDNLIRFLTNLLDNVYYTLVLDRTGFINSAKNILQQEKKDILALFTLSDIYHSPMSCIVSFVHQFDNLCSVKKRRRKDD